MPDDFPPLASLTRPKVVILNDTAVSDGGTAALALLSARLLRARGHQVTFISGDDGDSGELAALGIRLIALGGRALLDQSRAKAAWSGLYNPQTRDAIAALIAAEDTPDTVYHLHGWAGILTPAVFDALKPVARRSYIHAHDSFLACPNGVYYDFPRQQPCTRAPLSLSCLTTNCDKRAMHHKVWRSLRHGLLRRAFDTRLPWAGVLILHPGMVAGMTRAGIPAHLLQVVRNPAEPLTPTRIKAEANRRFAFIGRIEPGKGLRTLCDAARIAAVPLRVIGDGSARAALQHDFPEVEFTGWLAQSEIGAHLQDIRALVMPSRFPEPFGLVAAEASRSGLPVIMSDVALLAQKVQAKGLGLSCSAASAETLSTALRALAEMPEAEIRQISARGYEGTESICQSHDGWVDELAGRYCLAVG
ncbi:glycosyltransferase [Pseudooceanicola sp.]|uniref:glycosyltransferase n=1 Tax=Pseudooceanicola sp. TaxID=1914328 RepID=UPI002632F525|nr:glycosyltransferase [Pseudooceanicola sp.]MDF1856200.1 glycosyltransferase [Pseudooceanicola sp.]